MLTTTGITITHILATSFVSHPYLMHHVLIQCDPWYQFARSLYLSVNLMGSEICVGKKVKSIEGIERVSEVVKSREFARRGMT